MSLLTPLYVLGLMAVAAPVVFHLIRRTPRGEVPFSSLMFLSPTPPRLTRRSRLDNLLLLLLRRLLLLLLFLGAGVGPNGLIEQRAAGSHCQNNRDFADL